jgi:hypothetical protein
MSHNLLTPAERAAYVERMYAETRAFVDAHPWVDPDRDLDDEPPIDPGPTVGGTH